MHNKVLVIYVKKQQLSTVNIEQYAPCKNGINQNNHKNICKFIHELHINNDKQIHYIYRTNLKLSHLVHISKLSS